MQRSVVLHTVQQHNILPLTSYCNSKCLFCSHAGNPDGLKTISVGMRPLEEVLEDITFLQAKRDITIGESATRIIEGEPFLYSHITEVLVALRKKFSNTKLKITTNGTLLTEEKVNFLAGLGKLEINLSLNAVTPAVHKKLMGNLFSDTAIREGLWLAKNNIHFNGSMVAMPWLTGWDEITKALEYLQSIGASTVRVFMPGYTENAASELKFDPNFPNELKNFIQEANNKLDIPILLEPPFLEDFKAEISGVIKDTPASLVGLQPHDIIVTVDSKSTFSRVDAWKTITKAKNPTICLLRNNKTFEVMLKKKAKQKSGIVCGFDLDWQRVEVLKTFVDRPILVLTSELAFPLVSQLPELLKLSKVIVLAVKNKTFGGSIACAGLLTLRDIEEAMRQVENIPPEVLLPAEIFDFNGQDLFGQNLQEIEQKFNCKICVI